MKNSTNQYLKKQELIDKDEQIRLLLESSDDMITIHDFDGNYMFYSGPEKYKIKQEDIIGKTPYDFFETDIADQIVKQIKQTAKTGEKSKIEIEVNWFGKKTWFEEKIFPMKKNGNIISVIKICSNITDSVNHNQKIANQKEFLNNIINSLTHPLYVIDIESYDIVLANKATSSKPFPETTKCYAVTHNSDKPCWEHGEKCPVNEVRKTKKSCVVEHIHYNEKNEKRVYEVHGFPVFNSKNKLIQMIEYNIDITEKKEMEELLIKARDKADENNKLKSAFLANISHEIRTPMNAILGFGELLKKQDLSEEKRNKFIDIINSSGNHLLELINDIIDISKIDANQIHINLSECYLNSFMKDIYNFFNYQINNEREDEISLFLKSEIENDKDYIITDQKRLRQILINLISNAVKFTSEGSVKIHYSLLSNEYILFTVTDTGIGISESNLPYVFERFRQVGNNTEKIYGGTGLGLAISKGFVDLMGGQINVVSEEEKGSIFSFTIPYKQVK